MGEPAAAGCGGIETAINFDDKNKCDVERDDARIYYRQTATGYIVSDCGESVSGIMRRTGRDYAQASNRLCNAIGGALVMFDGAITESTGELCPDLPMAIIRVLSAVAACAEAGAKG